MVKEDKKLKLEDIELPQYFDNEELIKTNLIPLDAILAGGFEAGIIQLVRRIKYRENFSSITSSCKFYSIK